VPEFLEHDHAREQERMDTRRRSPGEHRIGIAAPYELSTLTDSVRDGGTCRHDRVGRPPQTERHRDLTARRVDEHVR